MSKRLKLVIMGRPNTGKSTLFNRISGQRKALVHDEPGVTRDRNEIEVDLKWGKKTLPLLLVDTGGLGGERFAGEIQKQVKAALKDAHVILFVFDGAAGLLGLDEELLDDLYRSGNQVPILGVVNKVDDERHEERLLDFYRSRLESLLTLSAEHGRGMDDLVERLMELAHAQGFFKAHEDPPESELISESEAEGANEKVNEEEGALESPGPRRTPAIAIVGRPNVGKSTLFNAILGEDRVITSPVAGTTVDSVDSWVELQGETYRFVDTAGIRRKSKTEQGIEVLSVVQAKKALERADLAFLVLDAEVGVTDQDQKISGLIEEAGCSVVIVMNKWDLHKKNVQFTKEKAAERLRKELPHLKYAPLVFVSARRRQGLSELGDLIEEILHQRKLKVSTHEFTEWVRKEAPIHNPKGAKFYLCHQSGRNPPTFVCHVNDPKKIVFSLKRHLINALRAKWGYLGTPIRMHFLEASSDRKKPKNLAQPAFVRKR
ncbi:MAG: ribosome biogenesis GTPase Der [Bdellovibrionia bacterium]